MAKYSESTEEIQTMVNDLANEMGLVNYGVDFQPLCVSKAKEVCKIVKANELAEFASNREDLVFVLCYEDAFYATDDMNHPMVSDETKKMWIRLAMDAVSYDTEKDKLVIGCPQITIPVGLYEKYGKDAVDAALLGQYTIAQLEQKKKEEAERKKALRTKRNKK